MNERKREDDDDGVVDAGAEAVRDIADELLGTDPARDPTPGPPATIRGEEEDEPNGARMPSTSEVPRN